MIPKKLYSASCLAAGLLISQPAGAAVVASWNMNESAGNIADSSGNGLTGTASAAGLTYGQASVTAGTYGAITVTAADALSFGSSINFTRAASGNFTLGAPGSLDTLAEPGPTGAFTIMAWVSPSALAASTTYRLFSTGPTGGWGFGAANVDQMKFTAFGQADFITSTAPLSGSASGWYHLALIWNAGAVTMYRNGQLVASAPASSGFTEETALSYAIGSSATGTEFFNGRIDEMKIYNTALTVPEIIAAATPVPEPSMALLGGLGVLGLLRRRR